MLPKDNELVIYDAEEGVIWAPGPALAEIATAEEENNVYTEFRHDGELVRCAERGGWQRPVVLWQSGSGKYGYPYNQANESSNFSFNLCPDSKPKINAHGLYYNITK